ncbi:MAG: PIG-L family deacetylase [Alicyclobacillaceae bacterium]|nr:PIG-L family deacetylase [Alicyclobacillaceae bacterium]
MNLRDLLALPNILDVKRVIAVQPHPDDNEVNAAGTLMKLSRAGCEVIYVTVTDGRAGGWPSVQNPEEIVRVRTEEKREAGLKIGVAKHIDLGFPDGGDYSGEEVTLRLVEIFRQERPELVFCVDPWMPYEAHPDHIKVGHAVAKAILFSNNAILYPPSADCSASPYQVPQIAWYATSYPNTHVDITNEFEEKLESILAHRSQFDNETWPLVKQYFELSAESAFQLLSPSSKGRAESFKVLSNLELHSIPSTIFS